MKYHQKLKTNAKNKTKWSEMKWNGFEKNNKYIDDDELKKLDNTELAIVVLWRVKAMQDCRRLDAEIYAYLQKGSKIRTRKVPGSRLCFREETVP